jgi:hypothetical protein
MLDEHQDKKLKDRKMNRGWPVSRSVFHPCFIRGYFLALAVALSGVTLAAEPDFIRVAEDQKSFAFRQSGKKFVPWGFNYDHDEKGRLIEDYWHDEWPKVEADFAEMRELGATVVRSTSC